MSLTIKEIMQLDTGAIDHSFWLTYDSNPYYLSIDWLTHTFAMCLHKLYMHVHFCTLQGIVLIQSSHVAYERLHSDTSARLIWSISCDILPLLQHANSAKIVLPTAVFHSLMHSLSTIDHSSERCTDWQYLSLT